MYESLEERIARVAAARASRKENVDTARALGFPVMNYYCTEMCLTAHVCDSECYEPHDALCECPCDGEWHSVGDRENWASIGDHLLMRRLEVRTGEKK